MVLNHYDDFYLTEKLSEVRKDFSISFIVGSLARTFQSGLNYKKIDSLIRIYKPKYIDDGFRHVNSEVLLKMLGYV